jgi:hypothetical protein
MIKVQSSIIILISLIGCASIQEQFDERVKKADALPYRYCVMAVSVEANGKLNQSDATFGCNNTENIKNEAIARCESNSGKKCLVTRIYDRNENRIMNNEARSIEEIKIRQRQEYTDNLSEQCTSYGFQKGTQAFADCMLKINQQNTLNQQQQQALKIQQDALNLQQLQQGLQMLTPPTPVSPKITCTTFPGSFTTTCQ